MKKPKSTVLLFFILIVGTFISLLALNPVTTSNPLQTILLITASIAAISFFFGLFTEDYSWTDRLWSTVPVGYAWIYAASASFSPNLLLSALLVTLWGSRLTANFARRGGYANGEDYRWPILKKRIGNKFLWQVFNLFFIAYYQQLLFVCFTLPLYFLTMVPQAPLNLASILCSVAMLLFLTLETLADQQQYTFQQAKYGFLPKQKKLEKEYEQGFRTSGLFSRSRHPNYLGELGFWWSVFAFSAFGTKTLVSLALLGPLMLTLLFIGSTVFTEQITSGKYPQYKEYKKRTWPILFRLW
jgi:steroid 5-alpha reductase family enzyme